MRVTSTGFVKKLYEHFRRAFGQAAVGLRIEQGVFCMI